jgi:hypothetical protein
MSWEKLLSYDPAARVRRNFIYDEDSDKITIHTEQDVTDITETNRAIANEDTGRFNDGWHRVASIPLNVYYDLLREGILDDDKAMSKWLNDPDNRYFRTKNGII